MKTPGQAAYEEFTSRDPGALPWSALLDSTQNDWERTARRMMTYARLDTLDERYRSAA